MKITGYKTYAGIILTILGTFGIAENIPLDDVTNSIAYITQGIDLILKGGGIAITIIGTIHKDIRLKKPV